MSTRWSDGITRSPIVAEIQAMEEEPDVRRVAHYIARYSRYDLACILARQDIERGQAEARARARLEAAGDEPTTWRDLWDTASRLCRDNAYALFLLPLAALWAAWGLLDWARIVLAAWRATGR